MFERAEQWSQDLEDNYEQLDKWKRKGDFLLYSMLPKSVADQLQNGQSTMDTCKANARAHKQLLSRFRSSAVRGLMSRSTFRPVSARLSLFSSGRSFVRNAYIITALLSGAVVSTLIRFPGCVRVPFKFQLRV